MGSTNILDDIYKEIKRQVWFDSEHKYTVSCMWPVATRFLWKDIKSFRSFPYIAFMSPEPNSGKTRALDVVGALACNPMKRGKYTPAVLLRYIDREWKKNSRYVTTRQGEIDNVFAHGKDNADLIQLYNLGNEEGGIVARCDLNSDEILETKAFCPKAFAGLKAARLPDPTKTRTIIISMKPATLDDEIPEDLDDTPLAPLSLEIDKWAGEQDLTKISIPDEDIFFLVNRNRQIWKPLLVVAKAIGEAWYKKGLEAARHFTQDTKDADKGLSHKILLAVYRVFRGGEYTDRIHSCDLLSEIHELGVPKWVETSHLADYLSNYDETIKSRQMKIDQTNRYGYEWRFFADTFDAYISEKERRQVEDEVASVVSTGEKDPWQVGQGPILPRPATPATLATVSTSGGMSTSQHTPAPPEPRPADWTPDEPVLDDRGCKRIW
jgi:hypothetical protein